MSLYPRLTIDEFAKGAWKYIVINTQKGVTYRELANFLKKLWPWMDDHYISNRMADALHYLELHGLETKRRKEGKTTRVWPVKPWGHVGKVSPTGFLSSAS